ncbi:MAG TPA: acyl-CoA dehydrogenase family protein [Acidimicrobiales bacterium]|nr:acyl-CoA dehydrogenase family protein [Acidimicrobiales bacterium]
MRFAWTDEQLAFAEATRDLLAKECPPAVVRAAGDAPPGGLDRTVWEGLDAMGVLGVAAPDAVGGLGLDETTLVPLLEEAGRVALPHPLVDTAAVAAPLGAAAGGRLVPTDLGGPLVACAADADAFLLWHPPPAPSTPTAIPASTPTANATSRPGMFCTPSDPGDGSCTTFGEGDGQRGALYLVEAGAVTVTPVATVDRGRRAGRVAWSAGDGELVNDDPAVLTLAADRGVLGTAAVLCGLAGTMLDLTVAYVGERRQFGVPIGSFQAVKHHLADALVRLEFARPAVARGAWSSAHPEQVAPLVRQRDVSMAKALAIDAAEACGRAALQCHGAIGYTVESDLHLFLKRSWALARSWGDRGFHTDRVGRALEALDAPAPDAPSPDTATPVAQEDP